METRQSRKSFERIHEDYGFFLRHSTEPAACRAAMLDAIRSGGAGTEVMKMMDFGCGGGEFLEGLLEGLNRPAEKLELELVEVDPGYLEMARRRVERFCGSPVRTGFTAEGVESSFDVITSNHVLYYVKDLNATLEIFGKRLKEGGLAVLILGGKGNQLCRLWEMAFARTGHKLPYYLAEDVGDALRARDWVLREEAVQSVLRFSDTPENRGRILRFLFEGKLEQPENFSDLMDAWAVRGEIVMENLDGCYIWKKPLGF